MVWFWCRHYNYVHFTAKFVKEHPFCWVVLGTLLCKRRSHLQIISSRNIHLKVAGDMQISAMIHTVGLLSFELDGQTFPLPMEGGGGGGEGV